jgi:hypothetical protein
MQSKNSTAKPLAQEFLIKALPCLMLFYEKIQYATINIQQLCRLLKPI